ncbi:MAG: family 78 glycoside hydrolase catalytic domain [Armatimonadetes bacterium]|nr:family 78 glycoside hydrolase catalytic domain [Armatimonadota bacterium]
MIGVLLTSIAMLNSTLVPIDLRVESLTSPLALPTRTPRFSWKYKSGNGEAKNLLQSGYRILVASSEQTLQNDRGDLWDSGKVQSSDQFGIRYGGSVLKSLTQGWWKIQVWDGAGNATSWTAPQSFGVGLNPEDWKAAWIHGDKPEPIIDPLEHANWIWKSGIDWEHAPAGAVVFTKSFEAKVAKIWLTVDNLFELRLNGKLLKTTTDTEGWRNIQQVDLTPELHDGPNQLEIKATNFTEGAAGLLAAVELTTAEGQNQTLVSDESWLADGAASNKIGENGRNPWGKLRVQRFVVAPAQIFQRKFSADKKLGRATLYATALGIADFQINGKLVSEDLFTPGWTDYRKRVQYRAFDVTNLVHNGENTLGAVLGQGWFSGYVAWGGQREHYGDTPMLKAQLELEFEDGSTQTVVTDSSWMSATGPILDEHFLHGEKYDARIQPNGWKAAGVGKWDAPLEPFQGNPVRVYQELKPKSITARGEGKYIIDFGQNLTGFVRLKLNEPAGTKISIRHAERLDSDGNIYTVNLRMAQAIDTYVCRGGGEETWNPRFTFHGFQYIEIEGLDHAPKESEFTALAISSSTPEDGHLETSDPMLNQLLSNAWWTQKMNFVDVPTDCPQRDERLGWTGDAQAYVQTASYFSDVQAFFTRWLITLNDDQRADGQFPMVAPVLKGLEDGGAAWADAGVICPTTIYEMYGDREVLERSYPNMKRFIEFTRTRNKPNLLPPDSFHCFGDWLSIKADTPNEVIHTAYFAMSAGLVADAAEILGHQDDAKKYRELRKQVIEAFRTAYVSADGRIKGDTQCGYVLAIAFDLLDDARAKMAANHLVEDIEKRGWHLSTGFVGTRDIMYVLNKIGRDDVAFKLLHQTTFPSWLFPIKNGATSIWERWDGWTPEGGFQDPGMNSFAHYAYGAVAGWMFKAIGGISTMDAGFGKVLIAPKIDPSLSWAKCSYDSVRGLIRCNWKKVPTGIELEVEVPPNVVAEVHIPSLDGKELVKSVGSGTHRF